MNKDIAYITVEDLLSTGLISGDFVINELNESSYADISCIEDGEAYFVIKINYEDWRDVVDICGSIVNVLISRGVKVFEFTCRDYAEGKTRIYD